MMEYVIKFRHGGRIDGMNQDKTRAKGFRRCRRRIEASP
jgi:hypothetical protein